MVASNAREDPIFLYLPIVRAYIDDISSFSKIKISHARPWRTKNYRFSRFELFLSGTLAALCHEQRRSVYAVAACDWIERDGAREVAREVSRRACKSKME